MKKFKLALLNKKGDIGSIELEDNFRAFEIKLSNGAEQKYQSSFSHLIDKLSKEGNFKITRDKNQLKVENSTKEFWLAFKQELITKLGIIPT